MTAASGCSSGRRASMPDRAVSLIGTVFVNAFIVFFDVIS
jgi:hypothetical protein